MSDSTETTQAVVTDAPESEAPAQVADAPAAEASPAPETPVEPAVAEATPSDDEAAEAKVEKLLKEVKSLRERKNGMTAELAALQTQLAEAQAKASELSQARERVAALEATIRTSRTEQAIRQAAPALRIPDTAIEAASRLMDQAAITYDEQGAPTNVAEVLAATVERYPVLTTATVQPKALPPTGTVVAPARTPTGDEALVGLSPRELAARFSRKTPALSR